MPPIKSVNLYHSAGKIWKLLIDDTQNLLFVEVRDEEEREVMFSAIDLTDQSVLWADYMLEEPWWLTMQYAVSGVLLITEFADSQNPEAKQLIAIDGKAGEGLWMSEGLFETANQQHVILQTPQQSRELVDIHTGNSKQAQSQTITQFESHVVDVQLPSRYVSETPYFDTVANFLATKFQVQASMVIDYLEHDHLLIIAYYEQEQVFYTQHLLIMTKSGTPIYQAILDRELKGIGNESFLVYNNLLIYIEEKHTVKTINLHHSEYD
ncbi:MAG: DUF4905 domain-containing protein [Flammeovirgaceae bacterium]